MKKYLVKKEKELLTYLIEDLEINRNKAKSFLVHKLITVNDKPISKYNYQLKENDVLTILDKPIINSTLNLDIIYEDKDFIVIDKPAGLLSISTEKEKDKTAYHLVNEYLKSKKESIYILHRLDKDTSGVLVFAKNKKLRDSLQASWNDLVSQRKYYAIVEGNIDDVGHLTNYLKITKDKTYITDINDSSSVKAITDYKVIKRNKNYALLDVDIKTGRKNQIRVSLADICLGVIGDKKYGKASNPLKRLGLHAYKLCYKNPLNGKTYSFSSAMPKEFEGLLK